MTGRPGHWTMEMNGGSSAPYLACTPCFPLFVHCLIGVETEGLLDYQGWAGIISIVRWNLRPVIFGVECLAILKPPRGQGLCSGPLPSKTRRFACALLCPLRSSPSLYVLRPSHLSKTPPFSLSRPGNWEDKRPKIMSNGPPSPQWQFVATHQGPNSAQ